MPISGGQAPPNPFLEVYDDDLAAGLNVTPTVSGTFSSFLREAGPAVSDAISTEIEQDSGTMTGWLAHETGVNYVRAVVGEAGKIRFRQATAGLRAMVVNRIA